MSQDLSLIEVESRTISEQVKALSIVNQESYENGAVMKITLAGLRKKINLFFEPMVKKAKESYDEVRNNRDKFLKPTVALEDELKDKLKTYERQKEREAEKARMVAEVERQKKIDEENKRRQDEADAKAKKEAELFNEDPKDVVADKVEEVNPDDIEVEQPLPTIEKVTGLGFKRTWKAKVIDKSKIPLEYLEVNMPALNRVAREMKEKFNVPGASACKD